jgi:hypothetical protein
MTARESAGPAGKTMPEPRSSRACGPDRVRAGKTSAQISEEAAAAGIILPFDFTADGRTCGQTIEARRST